MCDQMGTVKDAEEWFALNEADRTLASEPIAQRGKDPTWGEKPADEAAKTEVLSLLGGQGLGAAAKRV